MSILLLGARCACAPGDVLWEGLPACSHFLHDVISCGERGGGGVVVVEGGSAAKCQVPESHGSHGPPPTALPTSVGRSRCSRPALGWRAPSSLWNPMRTNTQLSNYINGTDAEGPQPLSPLGPAAQCGRSSGLGTPGLACQPRTHAGVPSSKSSPRPAGNSPLGQRVRPAGTPVGERVGVPRWPQAPLGLGSHPSICTVTKPAEGLPPGPAGASTGWGVWDLGDLPERPYRGPRWLTAPGKSGVSGSPQQSRGPMRLSF